MPPPAPVGSALSTWPALACETTRRGRNQGCLNFLLNAPPCCCFAATATAGSTARLPGLRQRCMNLCLFPTKPPPYARRSEEHTSELQSRGQLVCRLLLEKKKI